MFDKNTNMNDKYYKKVNPAKITGIRTAFCIAFLFQTINVHIN